MEGAHTCGLRFTLNSAPLVSAAGGIERARFFVLCFSSSFGYRYDGPHYYLFGPTRSSTVSVMPRARVVNDKYDLLPGVHFPFLRYTKQSLCCLKAKRRS